LLPDHPEFTFGFCFYVTQSVWSAVFICKLRKTPHQSYCEN
jgi:hypothetical protein